MAMLSRYHTLCVLSAFIAGVAYVNSHGGAHDEAPAATAENADAGPPPNLHSDALLTAKWCTTLVFFAVPFVGAWIPVFVRIGHKIVTYGLLYAAGLFFALALEHLTGDSVAGLATLTNETYPYGLLLVCCGYMTTWFFDLVVHAIWKIQEEKQAEKSLAYQQEEVKLRAPSKVSCCKASDDVAIPVEHTGVYQCNGSNCQCDGMNCKCSVPSGLEFQMDKEITKAGEAFRLGQISVADLVVLMLALCFHAVFEGLAVGLTTSVYDAWNLTLTIVLHKFFEGMALGASLVAKGASITSIFLYAFVFSFTAPIGVMIGIALDSSDEPLTAQWVEGIGNGFAAGVFIFVAVSHIMVKTMKAEPDDRWWTPFTKWFVAGLGVMTFSLLELRQS